jgi:hypothetical protein
MQTVIAYRNPLEAMIWESMMNGGAGPFLAVMMIALVGVGTYALILRTCDRNRLSLIYQHATLISTAVAVSLAVILHFWYIS